MVTQPPPTRYRVVERGRQLVVIDTQAGSHPLMGDYSDPPAADPIVDDSPREAVVDAWPSRPDPEPIADRVAPSALDPAPAAAPPLAAQQMIGGPPELLRNIAATVCGDTRDGDGRLILTTARFYDANGPRRIALDPDGERAVGLAMLMTLAASVAAIVLAVTTIWIGAALVIAAMAILRNIRTIATPWLDRLVRRS